MNTDEMKKSKKVTRMLADWLVYCVRIGWPKSSLDALEDTWWKYHDPQSGLLIDAEEFGEVKNGQ